MVAYLTGWPIVFLLLIAPFVHFEGLFDFVNLAQAFFIQTVSFGVLFAAWAGFYRRKHLSFGLTSLDVALGLFLCWSALSLLWTGNSHESTRILLHWLACFIVYIVVSRANIPNWPQLLVIAMTASCLGVSLLGCGQHLFGLTWVTQVVPPAATFGNKNMAAHHVCIVLPLTFALLLVSKKIQLKIFAWITFIAACFFLFFSKTWTAWIASLFALSLMTITLFIFFDTSRFQRSIKLILTGGVLAMLVIGLLAITQPGKVNITRDNIFSSIEAKVLTPRGSFHSRTMIWQNALEMIKERPLTGFGLENFKIYYPPFHTRAVNEFLFSAKQQPDYVHNDLIQIAVELGMTGLFLFLMFFVVAFRQAIVLPASLQLTREEKIITTGVGGAIAAVFVISLANFPFYRSVSSLAFFTCAGMLSSFARKISWEKRQYSMQIPFLLFVLAGVGIVLINLLVFRFNVANIQSDSYYKISQQAEKNEQWEDAVQAGMLAVSHNPHNMEALSAVGLGLAKTGRLPQSIAALETVLQSHPYNVNALINLATSLQQTGDQGKTLAAMKRILEILPEDGNTTKGIAAIYLQRKNYQEALNYFARAAKILPENAKIHANLGYLYGRKKMFEKAAGEYELAITLDPSLSQVHKSLAVIYGDYLNEQDKSAFHRQKYLESNQ
ncbi:MAG: O-antigen ligase family protein [Deltaproteobacteria bacterium]|nr:O-antigen ligase family protein [Deltaproteobacteria bacterium]